MSAPRIEGAGGLAPGAAVYLQALMQRFGCAPDLAAKLPEGERGHLLTVSKSGKPITKGANFFDPDRLLALWHPAQIRARLAPLPEVERRRSWYFFEESRRSILEGDPQFTPLPAWKTALSQSYFRQRFYARLGLHNLRPLLLLPITPLDHLLDLTPRNLIDLTDLMALHTLFTPFKRMIERDKREKLKAGLRAVDNRALLSAYMRHLQSDINEQTASVTTIQFPLDQWNWNAASFEALLRQFGLFCFAQLLKGIDSDFLEHIFLKLDLPASTQLRFLLKEPAPERANAEQISQTLHRLAAKASDFLSSHHPPLAAPQSPSNS